MTTIHLACAARSDYVPHGAAMLHSVLSRTDPGVTVHFLHGRDVGAEVQRRLTEMVQALGAEIGFLEVSEQQVAGLRTRGDFLPASHWYRIFLPDLLPAADKVLYLDADILALHSVQPLWETDLGSHYLGAVTNVFQADHLDRPARLGLEDPRSYFNSGVLLMNLALMRAEERTRALVEYARAQAEKLSWPEQDALNVVLGHRRLPLHPRWNAMNSVMSFPSAVDVFGAEVLEEARSDPALRHFEGPAANKPWHADCDDPLRELYLEHRRHTPWPHVHLEGERPRGGLRRLLRRRLSA